MGFGNLFAGEALLGIAFVVRIKLGHSTIRARRFARTYVTDEGLPQQVVDLLHGPVIKPIVVRSWPYDFRRSESCEGVPNRFRDLCQEPCCMPLWGSVPCGCYLPVVPRWDGHGPGVVCEVLRMLTATGPVR